MPCHPEAAQAFAKRRPANEEPAPSLPRGSLYFLLGHYATGEAGAVEIESRWIARLREQLGVYPAVRRRDVGQKPRPLAKNARRAGHSPFVHRKAWASPRHANFNLLGSSG